jgi:response regulator RpfG family c-di-GMP phosphodiesterase
MPPTLVAPSDVRGQPVPTVVTTFLRRLLGLRLLDDEAVTGFLQTHADRLADCHDLDRLGHSLVRGGLLTRYQLDRVRVGTTHGLVLGNYRVLEPLGSGGMGLVYEAEHCLLRSRVAVKVLPIEEDVPPSVRQRFSAEMRLLAQLDHPHVVRALDAGEVPAQGKDLPGLSYLVMELVRGGDLDQYVSNHGPLAVGQACDYIRQAAIGLQAAHDRHLIHRDLKPSNLLRTTDGRIKLVDFGLARQCSSRLTDHRMLVGSLEFMPPEQSYDASSVGPEADIYGLGAVLFWLLTGEPPHPRMYNPRLALQQLRLDTPRLLRSLCPEAPVPLEELLARLLDRDPSCRPTRASAVAEALASFLPAEHQVRFSDCRPIHPSALIIEDGQGIRALNRSVLEAVGCTTAKAESAAQGLEMIQERSYDLVLLDLMVGTVETADLCRQVRERVPAHCKIIVICGRDDAEASSRMFTLGADDTLVWPQDPEQLRARVQRALSLKQSQDQAARKIANLTASREALRQSLEARSADLVRAHDALLFTMAKMAESRDGETPGHLSRLQGYVAALAQPLASAQGWECLNDSRYYNELLRCVPLHDIGKIGLPEELLLKPGALNAAERILVETHPLIGDRMLEALAREHGSSLQFLGMARTIVRSHHERWDGRGYPDHLVGDAIPVAARLVALADVYDALRRERLHKPGLSHASACKVIEERSPGQFDPNLIKAFHLCHGEFERIYLETRD